MNPSTQPIRAFPLRIRIPGQTVVLDLFGEEHREPMADFAAALPPDDLLFLDHDITDASAVNRWIQAIDEGKFVTIVAWRDSEILGYASFDRGRLRWRRHVGELRVMVAPSARGLGIGRILLEMVFEMALAQGVTIVTARMTPDQTKAQQLFQELGFEEEAVLRDNAMDANGLTHDLLVLSFRAEASQQPHCGSCGVPVLAALSLDGVRLCSNCFELRYEELGGGD